MVVTVDRNSKGRGRAGTTGRRDERFEAALLVVVGVVILTILVGIRWRGRQLLQLLAVIGRCGTSAPLDNESIIYCKGLPRTTLTHSNTSSTCTPWPCVETRQAAIQSRDG